MIVLVAFIVGAILGWFRAAKRGGTTGDKVQYALVHAIAGALIALVVMIISLHLTA